MRPESVRTTLLRAAEKHAENPALWISGTTFAYGDLLRFAERLEKELGGLQGKRVGILAGRRLSAYAAIFACLVRGAAYIPLNPKWPYERVASILEAASPTHVLVDVATEELVSRGANDSDRSWHSISFSPTGHEVVRLNEIASGDQFGADDCLYIMFTSGSTGIPKGVPISESNAGHYVDEMLGAFDFDSTDRFLQSVELTFDLSVHDMLLCWSSGAALFAVPEAGAPMAPRFIKQLGITRSLSVPSAAAQAKAVGLVRPGGMPTLKTSFFCGEALPTSLVKSWAEAAPNSDIINIYGPTEATIAFSMFDCKAGGANDLSIAPIGKPIGRQEMRVDTNGELLLSGEQVFAGYLNDSERSARVLTDIDGRRWYRTGDLAEYDPLYGYIFKGRMDSQIKLRGYRVELGEVEGALRKASGTDLVAVLPVKEVGPGAYNDLLGVVAGSGLSTEEIRGSLTSLLPVYMVPSRIEALQAMPKNTNDKVDYIALASLFSKDLAGR